MTLTIVALGPGDVDGLPAVALAAAAQAVRLLAPELPAELRAGLGREPQALCDDPPDGATIVACDLDAFRLARRHPDAVTIPDRALLRDRAVGAAVARLAHVGAHLRIHCPWDRVQTAETIVPHTIEEAFELAEAIGDGDAAHQADELGDLLFQSVFLAQLLEEVGEYDLARIADEHADKLVARHPHVYGDAVAEGAGGVRDMWESNKRAERGGGIFHELPIGLPALAYATKAQRRAASVGFEFAAQSDAIAKLEEEVGELRADPGIDELGDVLFACVAVARALKVDPEIAVRRSAQRFRERIESAESSARAGGEDFTSLSAQEQLRWYTRAKGRLPAGG